MCDILTPLCPRNEIIAIMAFALHIVLSFLSPTSSRFFLSRWLLVSFSATPTVSAHSVYSSRVWEKLSRSTDPCGSHSPPSIYGRPLRCPPVFKASFFLGQFPGGRRRPPEPTSRSAHGAFGAWLVCSVVSVFPASVAGGDWGSLGGWKAQHIPRLTNSANEVDASSSAKESPTGVS